MVFPFKHVYWHPDAHQNSCWSWMFILNYDLKSIDPSPSRHSSCPLSPHVGWLSMAMAMSQNPDTLARTKLFLLRHVHALKYDVSICFIGLDPSQNPILSVKSCVANYIPNCVDYKSPCLAGDHPILTIPCHFQVPALRVPLEPSQFARRTCPSTQTNFYTKKIYTNQLLHKHSFTSSTFCRNQPLLKPAFTQTRFSTNHLLHQPALTQTSFYSHQLLHKPTFRPTSFCTNHVLHQPTFTNEFLRKSAFTNPLAQTASYTNQLYTTPALGL